ncbi:MULTISPECIES: TorF family putative porin [unclassified Ketobacter]|uniref:TorF family putative porin n=1 Tax=unclassified Ketobacter TaxID=2639109 RepID=UPI000F2C42B7|nr:MULTISPECIES: TorF family putative porin [unclassified Ketobacter]RLT90501.1 MAG: histidine kinase [Ketobacter sp. GenoA1]RLT99599.1 MAG: histidine kinase [Ketobacter sp.]
MLNKQSKMLRLSALSLAVAGAMAVAPTAANAEVSASVGVSNMYLWRGVDLGAYDVVAFDEEAEEGLVDTGEGWLVESGRGGVGAISGDLSYSNSGFYTGVWLSSGDTYLGSEYDLFVGYGAEIAGISFDVNATTYIYPNNPDGTLDNPGEASDLIMTVGFAGLSFTAYDNIAGGSGKVYYTLGYGYDAFSVLVGKHDLTGAESENMVHVDLAYAYNDNLSFIVSQQVDNIQDSGKPKVVVSYSLPIDM